MIPQLVDGALELTIAGSYSRLGYSARSRLEHWAPPDQVDGRIVLVTGATSGIGRSIADGLAGLGAVVIVVGRDESRGQSTVKAIIERTDNPEVSYERADLCCLGDVRDLADRVAHRHTRLDVLIHNAGALSRAYVRTEDGLELTVAVHVVAPFLLTHLLMGQLRAAPDGRVITMSSGGMYAQRLGVTSLDPHPEDYDGVKAYARAKRAQVELTRLWDLHHGGNGVRFVAMHPGWVATTGLDSGLPRFARLVGPMLRTPEQGADTAVWLATVPRAILGEGRFWLDRRPRREHLVPWTHAPPAEADRLWEWCLENAGLRPSAG
jgi:NAD(P)-dependent dehydrogenase (short-subunit alcohol dehydrogenase family)